MYTNKEHIHFVGIGGIGMSGIAAILKQQGYIISGCDQSIEQKSITQLKQLGCAVYHGNNSNECADPSIDILVYIPAFSYTIPSINTEINAARARSIPIVTRAQMLQELMRQKYSINITGSHGKTTTTGLVSHILMYAQTDPTIIIGGNLRTIQSNAHHGAGKFLVAEADESDRSFLDLYPTLSIITNISIEHLETYTDLRDIKQTFVAFINNLPFYGKAIVCLDDENIRSLLPLQNKKTITYGLTTEADIYASDIKLYPHQSTFTVHTNTHSITDASVTLSIPGQHNIQNALGAIAAALDVGISFETIAQALASFEGVERRFSYHGTCRGAEIFDDYAHHPKELENIFTIAKKRAKNRLIVVYQPHRYTRTAKLWNDFVQLLSNSPIIDKLIITDIYTASEQPIENITAQKLFEDIQRHKPNIHGHYISSENNFTLIKQNVIESVTAGDLVILLGAGSIYQLADELVK